MLPLLLAGALFACAPPQKSVLPDSRLAPPAGAPATAAEAKGDLELDAYTIPPPREWTDKYIHSDPAADVRYFRIKKLMKDFGLSRFWAVELQNHYRDLTRAGTAPKAAFAAALSAVREGRTGCGVTASKLESAPFIVVFDLDETLYQRSPAYRTGNRGPAWRDFSFHTRGEESFVKLRPGWEQAITRIHELGGLSILFTATPDDIAEGAAAQWTTASGKNILALADGLLSKSHLVLQEKSDGDPIVLPSKDLRLFDESLTRVIIVDDNPKLIVQHHRQRLIKKFQADPYLAAKNEGRGLAAPYEQALPFVVKEIEESLRYGQSNHLPFALSYLPYTMLGQVAMEALVQSGMTAESARQYIRQNPSFVDERF